MDEWGEEDLFGIGELKEFAEQLVRIISRNSPQRDIDAYPHTIKSHGEIISPEPGNLKRHGNELVESGNGVKVKHGYRPARYALYANATSRKAGYIEKSIAEFSGYMENIGWQAE